MPDNFLQDIRFGVRRLQKEKAFAALAILSLGLGLGAATTVITIVNAVLFRSLPFNDADRMLVLTRSKPSLNQSRVPVSYPDFRDWVANTKVFEDMAAWNGTTVNVSDPDIPPERYAGARITPNAFAVVGALPLAGRDFTVDDQKPGAPRVAILSYALWQSRYGGRRDILGQIVRIDEVPVTTVGVMRPGFRFPINQDVWMPLRLEASLNLRGNRFLNVYGKLAPNKTIADARAEANQISARLRTAYPQEDGRLGAVVSAYSDAYSGDQIRSLFLALLAAVGFVLLIVCANMTNLLLARSLNRAREMSIRAALGATRWKMIRQLLIECLLLGLSGGVLGLWLGHLGVQAFERAIVGVSKPYWIEFTMDPKVYAYMAATCIGVSVGFGLLPALRLSRADVNRSLREGGRGSGGAARGRRVATGLVAVQLALALVLLTGAGLMLRSFANLYGMSTAFDAGRFLTLRYDLPRAKYTSPRDRLRFYDSVVGGQRRIPGVEDVAVTSHLPQMGAYAWRVEAEGEPPAEDNDRPTCDGLVVSAGFFKTIRRPAIRGREFDESDGTPGHASVVVNERFAAAHWRDADPIGKHLRLHRDRMVDNWLTVIGVVPDIKQNDPQSPVASPVVYLPYRQEATQSAYVITRLASTRISVAGDVRRTLQALDRDLPVADVRTLAQAYQMNWWPFRIFGILFTLFAGFALLLAAVGLYAVVSYWVGSRRREIGLRMALGASQVRVLGWIVRTQSWQLVGGVLFGLAGAWGATRLLNALLVGISPMDPVVLLVVGSILLGVSAFATLWPAWKAVQIDPISTLREE